MSLTEEYYHTYAVCPHIHNIWSGIMGKLSVILGLHNPLYLIIALFNDISAISNALILISLTLTQYYITDTGKIEPKFL